MKKSAFILLRFFAAGIPFLFSVIVPEFISSSSTANLFYDLSKIAILSSILKLGMDSYILRRNDLAKDSISVSIVFLVQSIVIGLILLALGCNVHEVFGAILFSLLIVWGALELSLGMRLKSLIPVQFLFYPTLLIFLIIEHAYSELLFPLILSCIIYLPLLTKRTNVTENLTYEAYANKEYLFLAVYSVFSLAITNAPVLLAKSYLDDSLTIDIFQMIKFIGISSLISNIYVFLNNPNMQNGVYHIAKKDRAIIVLAVAIMVVSFNCFFGALGLIPLLGLTITVSILSFGNIKGVILVHKQIPQYLLLSIGSACLSFTAVLVVFGLSALVWAYYLAVIVEALLKIFISSGKFSRICRLP